MENKVDWIVHLVANTCCEECGEKENQFLQYACNAHTHGMEKYGHQDFQFVLLLDPKTIMYLLNSMGLRVQRGERFKAGDIVSKILEGYDIRLDEFEETGRKVLRVIVPDARGLFPDDLRCENTFRLQSLKTDDLYRGTYN